MLKTFKRPDMRGVREIIEVSLLNKVKRTAEGNTRIPDT